ncbi:MAG: hypothetical protein EWV72_22265 [Microcystis flos-aquae Mf_QC_C_20070823_S10]|nr:MAG: hypothetical protein EWV72_22265 [Microcystis flos-aquae Mf_QC_C_20070823_S10]
MSTFDQSQNFLVNCLREAEDSNNLFQRYQELSRVFNQNVHPKITSMSISEDGIFLTDHGPDHIRQVISKADQLAFQARDKLNNYETFLLLVAIHLHDIGNALGRVGHEQKAREIWDLVYGPLAFDELDRDKAEQIASVHGGTFEGSKDTIRSLDRETTWNNHDIRPQYLAAILKLADEMAEDRHRANDIAIKLNRIKKGSEIHHFYAYGLHSIKCEARACTMNMSYAYKKEYFERKFGSGTHEIDLLDEIFARSLKMYSEALYCSRYFRNSIRIDRVSVVVEIFGDRGRLIRRIPYVIEPIDYEEHGGASIYDRVPSLSNYEGKGPLTPALLASLI